MHELRLSMHGPVLSLSMPVFNTVARIIVAMHAGHGQPVVVTLVRECLMEALREWKPYINVSNVAL